MNINTILRPIFTTLVAEIHAAIRIPSAAGLIAVLPKVLYGHHSGYWTAPAGPDGAGIGWRYKNDVTGLAKRPA